MGIQWKAAQHRRAAIETEIELHLLRVDLLLARLDRMDGDCDVELNGDEEDGTKAEDDFCLHNVSWSAGAGCPLADGIAAEARL